MLSFAAGGHWSSHLVPAGADPSPRTASWLVRATALLPALLVAGRGPVTGGVWLAVGLGSGLAGAVESSWREGRVPASAPHRWSPAQVRRYSGDAVVRITGWPRRGRKGRWSAPGLLVAWQAEDCRGDTLAGRPRRGDGLLVSGRGDQPAPGEILAGPLELQVAPEAPLPGAFDYRRYLSGRGLTWQGRLLQQRSVPRHDVVASFGREVLLPVRAAIVTRLGRILPPREAGLATAVLLGVRSPANRNLSAPFAALGLAHLFAVSGLHVGILLGIILLPGRWLASPRLTVLSLWLFVPLYLLLTGMPGSVVRAGGMGLLAAQAKSAGRQVDPLRLLGLLYWAGSVLAPLQNLDTGLQLSYLAAGGILVLSRATNGLKFSTHNWCQALLAGLAVSFAAQWFTLPVVAASFGRISLVSPLANLLGVPLFGLAVWAIVTGLVASLVWLPLGQAAGALGWLLLRLISGGVTWASRVGDGLPLGLPVPGSGQVAGWIGLSLLLLLALDVRQRCPRRWLPNLVAWGLVPWLGLQLFGPLARQIPDPKQVVVWQFAVGQGDCGLLCFPDGWLAMIDTGGRYGHAAGPRDGPLGRNIMPFLGRQGLGAIDAVLLTHGHLDHTGGALALESGLKVERWYVSGRAGAALTGAVDSLRIEHPETGRILHRWQDWTLEIAYPLQGQQTAPSENNWSLVAVLRQGAVTRMVWSGDLEFEGEAAWLASQPRVSSAQVWKAGHHGSNTSGSGPLLRLLKPELVLVSCGVENSYGHPSHGPYVVGPDTLRILRTDLDGSIRLSWGEAGGLDWRTSTQQGDLPGLP